MSFEWPVFTNETLDGNRTWSATFQSYDQHYEDTYWTVTVSDGSQLVAKVSMYGYGDNWETPEFTPGIRLAIAAEITASHTR